VSLVVEPLAGTDVVRVSRWIFNCYVVPGDDGPVVVDAGLPGAAEDLAPVLAGSRGALQAVVATHGHSDHVAGAARLAARHGDAPVHLPETTLTYLTGVTPRTPTGRAVASIWPTIADQRPDACAVLGLTGGAGIAGFGTARGMVWTGPAPAGGLADGRPLPGASAWTVLAVPATPTTASPSGTPARGRCSRAMPSSPRAAAPGSPLSSSTAELHARAPPGCWSCRCTTCCLVTAGLCTATMSGRTGGGERDRLARTRLQTHSVTFDVATDDYGRFMGRFSEPLAAVFADHASLQAGQSALDVGCGPGVVAAELATRLGTSAVTAFDPSQPFVEAVDGGSRASTCASVRPRRSPWRRTSGSPGWPSPQSWPAAGPSSGQRPP